MGTPNRAQEWLHAYAASLVIFVKDKPEIRLAVVLTTDVQLRGWFGATGTGCQPDVCCQILVCDCHASATDGTRLNELSRHVRNVPL